MIARWWLADWLLMKRQLVRSGQERIPRIISMDRLL